MVEKLPEDLQDAIATRLLAEAADEDAWAQRFEATTDTEWDRLAGTVRREVNAKSTTPLEGAFSPPLPL